MKRLLLSLLFIPFFTSSSWADPEKPSGNLPELESWEDTVDSLGSDKDFNEADSSTIKKVPVFVNQEKIKSIKQGQKRKSGWGQKPTSNKRKSVGSKSKSR